MVRIRNRCFRTWDPFLFGVLLLIWIPVLAASRQDVISASFVNHSSHRVTLDIDSHRICDVVKSGKCDFKITKGSHTYHVQRDDNEYLEKSFEVPQSYEMLCMRLTDEGLTWDDCDIF